jgi:hypothetical protein
MERNDIGNTMLKIGIIDADLLDNGTRHPNLALMKISGYYKKQGHNVELLMNYSEIAEYDKVYISRVFNFTHVPNDVITLPNVIIGGTGFFADGGENLPDEIEHHKPDYNLYLDYANSEIARGRSRTDLADYLDYSIGFTTRGCFRKCEFCVNKKYDRTIFHSPIEEFYDSARPYIYLWDDNFLAFSEWEKILDQLELTGKPFQFRQGLDIRLMTDEKAKRFSSTRYHGDFIFAFDHIEDRNLIEEKLKLWKRYCSKTTKLYVLCAYDSQDEKDIINTFERIKILMKYGCLPYIMRYESYQNSSLRTLYIQLARWCNQPQFFKKKSFRQFCEANQTYHKNKETTCSAYQCMMDFEATFPNTAKQYFDLRYDEENIYGNSYGYGRKYANKHSCDICTAQQQTWEDAYCGLISTKDVLVRYYQKEMDLQCLAYPDIKCVRFSKDLLADWFCDLLFKTDLNELFLTIKEFPSGEQILPSNIPQFSDINDAFFSVPEVLYRSGATMSFDEIGVYLDNGKDKNEVAQRKYGENHSKLATLLDLAVITSYSNAYKVNLSVLGAAFCRRTKDEQKTIAIRLILRIPIVQKMLFEALDSEIDISSKLDSLSIQTQKRRHPNVITLIQLISQYTRVKDSELSHALYNIKGWK